jgi:hypothetical protein
MYNFSSMLKAISITSRAPVSFSPSANGPVGLLTEERICSRSGGVYRYRSIHKRLTFGISCVLSASTISISSMQRDSTSAPSAGRLLAGARNNQPSQRVS